jgi:hypothetical protein
MLVVRCTLSNFCDKLCQLLTPMAFSESSKNKKRRPDITEKLLTMMLSSFSTYNSDHGIYRTNNLISRLEDIANSHQKSRS